MALHLANALLVLVLLRILVRRDMAALAGAMLFAASPLMVESVAWISELKGLLATFFSLAAMILYLKMAMEEDSMSLKSRSLYSAAVGAFGLALLSKPSAAPVPLMLYVMDAFVLGRGWKRPLPWLAPWCLGVVPFALIAKLGQPDQILDFIPPPLYLRPVVALDALAFYAGKILLPFGLGLDYGRSPSMLFSSWFVWITWAVPVAVATALYCLRRKIGWLAPGLAVFALGLAPVLGLTPFLFQAFSTVADRYVYLSMVGISLALASGLARCKSKTPLMVAALVLACYAALSANQVRVWKNNLSLYENAVEVNPRAAIMRFNLGKSLKDAGDVAGAVKAYRECLRLDPENFSAMNNLSWILATSPDPALANGPQALEWAIKANEITGWGYPGLLDTLAAAYARTGDFEMAVRVMDRAVELALEQGMPDFARDAASRTRLYQAGHPLTE